MIWMHEKIFRHRVRYTVMEPVWVHGGQRPKRVLINCSCGRAWVRR